VLYTDGVTEARNNAHDFFGEERLQAHLGRAAGESAEGLVRGLVEAVQTFTEGAPQADDVTVLAGVYG
jgi:sigma-B regulation protein RsbU (phosphoserine phosphatase)